VPSINQHDISIDGKRDVQCLEIGNRCSPAAGCEATRNKTSSATQANPSLAVPQLICCLVSYRLAMLQPPDQQCSLHVAEIFFLVNQELSASKLKLIMLMVVLK
jgi:hypothetical protein